MAAAERQAKASSTLFATLHVSALSGELLFCCCCCCWSKLVRLGLESSSELRVKSTTDCWLAESSRVVQSAVAAAAATADSGIPSCILQLERSRQLLLLLSSCSRRRWPADGELAECYNNAAARPSSCVQLVVHSRWKWIHSLRKRSLVVSSIRATLAGGGGIFNSLGVAPALGIAQGPARSNAGTRRAGLPTARPSAGSVQPGRSYRQTDRQTESARRWIACKPGRACKQAGNPTAG